MSGEISVVSTRIWKPSFILRGYQYQVSSKISKLGWVCVKENVVTAKGR